MNHKTKLTDWSKEDGKVRLIYEDDTVVYISQEDFDRAFGCIVALSKEEVLRDYAIE